MKHATMEMEQERERALRLLRCDHRLRDRNDKNIESILLILRGPRRTFTLKSTVAARFGWRGVAVFD